jgi:hypothetical protein
LEIHLDDEINVNSEIQWESLMRYADENRVPPSVEMHLEAEILREMYFSNLKPPAVSERMWSVTLDASIAGEYQT